MGLATYRRKRNFGRTPEPRGRSRQGASRARQFVVQKHDARRLHYDFRLQIGDVLKSWAVPKGPSLDPKERRLAVETEDHPLEYGDFEGVIPEKEYGAGPVLVWDRGYWFPDDDPEDGLEAGRLEFRLAGEKLRGGWRLVRMPRRGREKKDAWLLMKRRDDEAAKNGEDLMTALPESVISGRRIEEVEAARDRQWHSNRGKSNGSKRTQVKTLGNPADIEGATAAPMPRVVVPQLATLVKEAPEGSEWLHEIKLDGYRMLCRLERHKAHLHTRKGNDWSRHYPDVVAAIEAFGDRRMILDGEVVMLDEHGRSRFQGMQSQGLQGGRGEGPLLFAFDLLYLDGYDLTGAPLRARKEALRLLLATQSRELVRYSDHVVGHGQAFFDKACELRVEGIVSKRADAPYRAGRSRSWLKIKCQERQELVIVGFTEPKGARAGLGALHLAVNEPEGLRYAGKVGTGFNSAMLADLRRRLDALETPKSPVTLGKPRGGLQGTHWVKPTLVAEVTFSEWTNDGHLRHPSFVGLRADKAASEVVREQPAAPSKTKPEPKRAARPRAKGEAEVAGVRITHPDKILYPECQLTKLDLARYYEAIAEAMLPELRQRPLTLFRCPEGRHKSCFYQKHAGVSFPKTMPRVTVKPGEEYLMVADVPSLITLAQLGVLEIHVWGARADKLDRPDRLVIDLDPGPGVPWSSVVTTAITLRQRLEQLGLAAFPRLTGGKGLHVVVPIERHATWDEAKGFTQGLANELVRHAPKHFIAKMTKKDRRGKIFVDYLRNAKEATAIASYSVRARPGAPVALPVSWDELETHKKKLPLFGIDEVKERVATLADPWPGFDGAARRLTAAMMQAVASS
jgi:bifunctional non-homologous end joining protein LigD